MGSVVELQVMVCFVFGALRFRFRDLIFYAPVVAARQ
jgi:hypothetical protein